jgi:hypothetical protein
MPPLIAKERPRIIVGHLPLDAMHAAPSVCRWLVGHSVTSPARDNPSSSRWKYTMPAYGCHLSTALVTPP